jgi:hypothetical protein
MRKHAHADSMSDDRQTLCAQSNVSISSNIRVVKTSGDENEEKRTGRNIQLILALGRCEPCHNAEDDDEDESDNETPAIVPLLAAGTCGLEDWREVPVRHDVGLSRCIVGGARLELLLEPRWR